MLSVGSIVIRVDDLERQAAFWEVALDYQGGFGTSRNPLGLTGSQEVAGSDPISTP